MKQLLRLLIIAGFCMGTLGQCANKSLVEISQSQQLCHQEDTHDTATYRQALKRQPSDMHALVQLGYEQIKATKGQAAIATFTQALTLASQDIEKIEIYRGLGEAYLVAEKFEMAGDAFLQGLRLELPSSHGSSLEEQVGFRMAMIYYHRCDWESAISSFRESYGFLERQSHWLDFYLTSLTHVYTWSELQAYFAKHHRPLERIESLGVGHKYAAQLKQDEAIAIYQQFIPEIPLTNDTPASQELVAQYLLGEGLALGKQYDQAASVLQNVYQTVQDNPALAADIPVELLRSTLSTVWVQQQQFDKIEALWSTLYPEPSMRDFKLGEFYLWLDSPQDTLPLAEQQCEQSIQARPSADAYECLGDAAFRTQQYQTAVVAYQQAYELGKKVGMLDNLSYSYEQLKQYDKAIETIQRLIETEDENQGTAVISVAYQQLAHLYIKQQRWSLAQEAFERSYALANPSDDAETATAKGELAYGQELLEANEYDRAISACDSAVSSLPQNPEPLICLGAAYQNKGNLDQALNYLEQAQSLAPSDQDDFHSLVVSSFYQQGELQSYQPDAYQSITQLQYYLPSMAARAQVNETLGEILLAQQQYEKAALTFKTALYEYPLSARASLGLAKSLVAQEYYGGAIAVLNRYLKVDPEHAEAQALLEETLLAY
ncbi:MAG: tetratricopeptide repeat protein [Cyanobacteria bacterium P01_C01_bin.118]